MEYYTKFDERIYHTGLTNNKPEDMTGVWEVSDTQLPNNGFRLILDNGVVRSETEEEHVAELLRLKSLIDIREKRSERDFLLEQSDVLVLPDRWATYGAEKQIALTAYRQALRELPQRSGFPNIGFPILPN